MLRCFQKQLREIFEEHESLRRFLNVRTGTRKIRVCTARISTFFSNCQFPNCWPLLREEDWYIESESGIEVTNLVVPYPKRVRCIRCCISLCKFAANRQRRIGELPIHIVIRQWKHIRKWSVAFFGTKQSQIHDEVIERRREELQKRSRCVE